MERYEGFDESYYGLCYPDVLDAEISPLEHYLSFGWKECRNPSAEFDTVFYRAAVSGATHPDVCPLVHYNEFGQERGLPRNRTECLAAGGCMVKPGELIDALPSLRDYFGSKFYIERYPDVVLDMSSPLEHYLTRGWREGRNPSAEFDTAFYRETFQWNDNSDICPLVHWLLYGASAGVPTNAEVARKRLSAVLDFGERDPSEELLGELDHETVVVLAAPHFDRDFYLNEYPDVRSAKVDPLMHFLQFGAREGRSPNRMFDVPWYAEKYMRGAAEKINPLVHFATIGRAFGLPSCAKMSLVSLEKTADAVFSDTFQRVLQQLRVDIDLLSLDRVRRFVLPLFSPEAYRRLNDLPDRMSNSETFLRYLVFDLPNGQPPGPMFQEGHYLTEVDRHGIARPRVGEPPFHHWMVHGAPAGLSPVPGFDAQDYLSLNPDLADYPDALFIHFIRHGQYEAGRQFTRLTTVAPSQVAGENGNWISRARQFCEETCNAGGREGELTLMRNFMESKTFKDIVKSAAEIEPEVGIADHCSSIIPPWYDAHWAEYSQLLRLLPEGPFDAIVLMPFCKLGGADFVAGVLTTVLSDYGRVLVIRTDAEDWDRPDWFPENAVSVDLSGVLRALAPELRTRMLYAVLQRYHPRAVFNVNSRVAFDTFVRYGERLTLQMQLYAYYFCADRTPDGHETGYPVWYFSNILPCLTAAMIDNKALANQLIGRYNLTGAYRDRVRVVYTPSMTTPPETTMAELQLDEAKTRSRKRVLWAGRLDTQKRFELVQQVARLLPDVDFECWGKPVLDAPPDLSELPQNLSINPPFAAYNELPLTEADGWLYTSAWDGIPTILIELAAMGMPIVASAAGGVPELIDETTGWPVGEAATAEDYATAVEAMINSPEERVARAQALKDRARRQHSRQNYAEVVATIGYMRDEAA